MNESKHRPKPLDELSDVEHIRERPSMYLGNTNFSGVVQYVVSAFDIMLAHGAEWIEIEIAKNLRLSSNAIVPVCLNDRDELEPFEAIGTLKPKRMPDATILMALSYNFRVAVNDGKTETTLESRFGKRKSLQQQPATTSDPGTTMEFYPDFGIFSVKEVSPWVIHSYCRRTACLYPGVQFRVRANGNVTEYRSVDGIRDYFDAVTLPYQIVHKPICIHETEEDLTVESVFAFHNWTENQIWSFANKGRVPDGGTHEAGMLDALSRMYNRRTRSAIGVLGVLAIEYPNVTLEGCLKSRVYNPELRERVCNLVTIGLDRWFGDNEDEVEYLKSIERFQFADIW